MRTVEIIAGLILAFAVFIVLKIIGLLIQFALIGALIGYVIGHLIARALRGGGAGAAS